MVAPKDTTPEAFAWQLSGLRLMSPQERLRRSFEMSDELREVAKAGIRARHPEYGDPQVGAALEVLLLGRDLASAVRRARPVARR
jgi:hypothetical protein